MAMDLKAVLRLQDKLSAPMKRATQAVERMNKVAQMSNKHMDHLGSKMNHVTNATKKMSHAAHGASGGILSMYGGMLKMSAAMGMVTATAAPFLGVMKSIQEAAKFEQSNIQIKAMFQGDTKSAQKYMSSLEKMAINSPLLNSQDMLANSKSFIGQTRNLKTLDKAWKVAEKLMAWSPEQNVQSVVFAMRELASGDAISMVERFELPRGILNDIKKLKFEDQLTALDKLMAKFRITDKYIEEVGSSAISLWNQLKERSNVALRQIGEGALKELKPVLADINKWMDGPGFQRFKNSTAKALAGGFHDILSGARSTWNYIERTYINNPAFEKLNIQGKLSFIISDLFDTFNKWLSTDGRTQIDSVSKVLVSSVASAIEAGAPRLAQAGLTVGSALGQSFASSIVDEVMKNPVASLIVSALAPGGVAGKLATLGITGGWSLSSWALGKYEAMNQRMNVLASEKMTPNEKARRLGVIDGSHANGLSYVPFNGYRAELHKGERVLTAQENREYSNGGPATITFGDIHLHGVGGDMKKAAKELMGIMANEIQSARGLMART